jgi:DNA-binding NtrC family response regulator
MFDKKLLCVSRAGVAVPFLTSALQPDWQLTTVTSFAEADRALRASHFLVGLLTGFDDVPALQRFLREHTLLHWVGLCERAQLTQPDWRELIAEHLHDYHTLPATPALLRHTLGHAHGCALLRTAPCGLAAAPMGLTGNSPAITRLRTQIARVAQADAPVLIWGESGSGKELAAQAVHAQSPRRAGPFVPINCGAIPPALIQSELFGHARGAFTGAAHDKIGLIESASGGTVFLDEIADLPKDLQSNLLRFLQEKTIHRVGATRSIGVDARVVAASHVKLEQAVADGQFREDLYYRLNVLPINVPPLRERKDDLAALATQFFHAYPAGRPARLKGFSSAALRQIRAHPWPGNVRELINRVRRALVLAEGRLITPADLGLDSPETAVPAGLDASRLRAERDAILASLARAGGNVTHAARELAVSRMTLYRQMAKHGIGTQAGTASSSAVSTL